MGDRSRLLVTDDACWLGEGLRRITFVGEGYGCYEDFDTRDDARPWSASQVMRFFATYVFAYPDDWTQAGHDGTGLTFQYEEWLIDCAWVWDGDGTLVFAVREGDRIVRLLCNHDCKRSHEWVDLVVPDWSHARMVVEVRALFTRHGHVRRVTFNGSVAGLRVTALMGDRGSLDDRCAHAEFQAWGDAAARYAWGRHVVEITPEGLVFW